MGLFVGWKFFGLHNQHATDFSVVGIELGGFHIAVVKCERYLYSGWLPFIWFVK